VIYILGTLGFSLGTAVMAMFPNVYVTMIMISTMGIVSMSISYCPYALLGQYHDIKQVRGILGVFSSRQSVRIALKVTVATWIYEIPLFEIPALLGCVPKHRSVLDSKQQELLLRWY